MSTFICHNSHLQYCLGKAELAGTCALRSSGIDSKYIYSIRSLILTEAQDTQPPLPLLKVFKLRSDFESLSRRLCIEAVRGSLEIYKSSLNS